MFDFLKFLRRRSETPEELVAVDTQDDQISDSRVVPAEVASFEGLPAYGVPAWVLRPLPVNATIDESRLATIDVAESIDELHLLLNSIRSSRSYDAAVNRASSRVWRYFSTGHPFLQSFKQRVSLVDFAAVHMTPRARSRILRRLVKDPEVRVRRAAERRIGKTSLNEVALPAAPDGDWDTSGWLHGLERVRHEDDRDDVPARLGLPVLSDIGGIREFFDIRSPRQLGWFLTAPDDKGGPYTRFTIPKRNGTPRVICAPKWQLRLIQQRILHSILYKRPVHPAAHGFIPGRSIVTNAEPHVGSEIIIKFDLKDFFPTISHYRVVGLFASLGYDYGDGRFATFDRCNSVAPTLARLCMYTEKPRRFGDGQLPQGAPSSPAITNLICRMLDARLSGLARKNGGRYTRYADDLTFSFPDNAVQIGRFRWWVDQICHQEGFLVNQDKFRIIRRSQRQSVTGIVVNDSLSIPRRERRRFRAILNNCRAYGVESQTRGDPGFRGWLRGFASYLNMVHPEEGRAILDEVNELLDGPQADFANE